jgi:outer membrane lipoprotein carrier protein
MKTRALRPIAGLLVLAAALLPFAAQAKAPATAAPAAAAAPAPATVLDRVQAFYRATPDFKASFRQVVNTRSPKRTFTRSGTVFFKRPGMMRWDYSVPDEVFYVCDGVDFWSYDVAEGIVYRLKVEKSDLFQSLRFLTGTADLAKEFDVAEQPAEPSGLVPLRLTPKGAEKTFRSVTLFVDPKTGETRETEVEDPVGNVSRVRFDNASFAPLPADGFRFRPPEGVRVQDLGSR